MLDINLQEAVSTSVVDGSTDFYSLTVAAGASVTFDDADLFSVAAAGTLTLDGAPGNQITFNSDEPGTQTTFTVTTGATQIVDNVGVTSVMLYWIRISDTAFMSSTMTESSGAYVADIPADSVALDTVVQSGSAARMIADQASSWEADLVVVGSHGKGLVDRVLLGSTTERLLNKLPCSILVIPVRGHSE